MVPVRLRGHHFLCILTFKGYGYTPDFVANMVDLVADISAGRPVQITQGPDDICAGLDDEGRALCNHDCAKAETRALDELALRDIAPILGPLDAPLVLTADMIASLRAAFAAHTVRAACDRCPWHDFCDEIVASGYEGTKLWPHASCDLSDSTVQDSCLR